MSDLSKLNDQSNLSLTQLSYSSGFLKSKEGRTFGSIYESLKTKVDKAKELNSNLEVKDILSSEENNFYDMMNQFKDENPFSNYRVKNVGNDEISGFGAVCFLDGNGNTGFSFRGTDGITNVKDMTDNIIAGLSGHSVQTEQALAFFEEFSDPNGNNRLYGHSKGGNLAEYVFARNHKKIKNMHLLNPQPLNPYSLNPLQLTALQSDKVDIVLSEGDYVWFIGCQPTLKNIRVAKVKEGEGGYKAHFYKSLDLKDGNIRDGEMPIWEYGIYAVVVNLGPSFQGNVVTNALMRFETVCIVSKEIVNTYEKGKDKCEQYIEYACSEFKKMGKEYRESVNEFRAYCYKLVTRVDKWYNKTLDTAKNTAYSNPHIVVDTYKLQRYAERLQAVNNRVSKLDSRLDNLYWKVGLKDLWSLMQADMLTGYSWRITRCISYLKDTASDFEKVESELQRSL